MRKTKLKVLASLVTALMVSTVVANAATTTTTIKTYTSKRLAGKDRFETSLSIAKEYNSSTLQNVIITTAYDFPDALSGSVLASKLNAPILLVGKDTSDSAKTLDYINTHLAKTGRVYILGSEGVVGTPIISKLQSLGYKNFTRLAGANRIETNLQIVNSLNVAKGTPVIIATQNDFPDALSISGIASKNGYPILLSAKDSLDSKVLSKIKEIAPSKIYIVGSEGVVGVKVEIALNSICNDVIRIGGYDRFQTSARIAEAFKSNTTNAIVATGFDFPDALAGSVLAAAKNAPILLVDSFNVSEEKDYLDLTSIKNLFVLGSEGAVSKDALDKLTVTPMAMQTPTGLVTSKIEYTDSEMPDNPTLQQMVNMSKTVTYQSNPEMFTVINGEAYISPGKMNLTNVIYHVHYVTHADGYEDVVHDEFYKILRMHVLPSIRQILKYSTKYEFVNGNLTWSARNYPENSANKDEVLYLLSEKEL